MRVLEITPENLGEAWEHAAPWLEQANLRGRGRYPLADIRAELERGVKRLYKVVDGERFAWMLIGVTANSAFKTCTVYALAGRGALDGDFLPHLAFFAEMYALHNGANYVTCSGRPGWTRALRRFGWEETGRICGKEL
ncbi:MAG: hypothetical protein FWG59_01890 [Betaproteobacteria bacterium]|nr:hypothetical protein [Betaproteobacteria bacterium]